MARAPGSVTAMRSARRSVARSGSAAHWAMAQHSVTATVTAMLAGSPGIAG